MNKIIITLISVFAVSCSSDDVQSQKPSDEIVTKIFSKNFSVLPELGEGAIFSSTDVPAIPEFSNARMSYNLFETAYADDLTYWEVESPANVVVNLILDVDTPFGVKDVSHTSITNGSFASLYKILNYPVIPILDLTDRHFEYSVWLYNNNTIPSRLAFELANRFPPNGFSATACILPPKQWVRCSGRLHTGLEMANEIDFRIRERQIKATDGDIDIYVTNASLIDITEQISTEQISEYATTENIEPLKYHVSARKNDEARYITSIGDSIYEASASGVSSQQARSTALGIEILGGFVDARATGGWSVTDMYDDLVTIDPITNDEKVNSLPIISPGSNDAGDDILQVPVQKQIVDDIVELFTDVGNNNFLVLAVHGNSDSQHDLDTAVAYNKLLADTYGDRFLDTWEKLKEISDPVDRDNGVISARFRENGDGLHLTQEGKMHIVRWSIERLKSLGYPDREGSSISEVISYKHSPNDALSYPATDFDETAFTVILKWSPGKSQANLSDENGVLSVNGEVQSLLYVNATGVHSMGGLVPVTVNPSFEANKTYTIAVHGSTNGNYQIGIHDTVWLWSADQLFSSYSSVSSLHFGLSTEMIQNFELVEIYADNKSIKWIESAY